MEYFLNKAVNWALLEKIIYGSRSSHQRCSVKNGVLRNFAKFTGKHLFQSNFAKFTGKHLFQSLFFNRDSGTGVFLWTTFLWTTFYATPLVAASTIFAKGWSTFLLSCRLSIIEKRNLWQVFLGKFWKATFEEPG